MSVFIATVSGSSGTSSLSQNVFCFGSDLWDPDTNAEALEGLYTAWCAHCPGGAQFALDPEFREVDAVSGQTLGIGTFGGGVLWNLVGTDGGTRLPDATAVVLRWRSGFYFAGKPVNGRSFLPYGNTANGEGGVNGTTQSEMNTAGADFITAAEGFIVWSRTHGVTATVDTASTWSEYGVQRRRRD